MANSPMNPNRRPQQLRSESGVSFRISPADGSWSVIEKEPAQLENLTRRFSARKILRHATMPLPKRTNTERTVASSTFSTIYTSPDSATNGVSAWNRARSYLASVSGLAAATINSATIEPPFFYEAIGLAMPGLKVPPYTPDIEVKSKRRKGPLGGGFKWKEMRAVLDTGCTAGNWVSLETLEDLGYDKLLELTEIERNGAVTAAGFSLRALYAVNLTWRGVPGEGQGRIGNCSRNFKMRFLVLDIDPAPFEILIGSHSIWKYQILQGPMFMAPQMRRSVIFPPEVNAPTTVPSYADRKAANEKEKKERKPRTIIRRTEPATLTDQVKKPVDATEDKDPKAAVPRTDTGLSTSNTLHDEAVSRVQELTNEAKKKAGSTPKLPGMRRRSTNTG